MLKFLVILFGFTLFVHPYQSEPDLSIDIVESLNKIRATPCNCGGKMQQATSKVVWNVKLARAAEAHATDLARTGRFSHKGTNGSSSAQRLSRVGYNFRFQAENIAEGQRTVAEVMQDWKESKGHCVHLMSPYVTEVGAARVGKIWVLEMASPLN